MFSPSRCRMLAALPPPRTSSLNPCLHQRCALILVLSMSLLRLRVLTPIFHATRVAQRHLTTNTREAFLEPLASHPGITCLSLNRPASKNAISVRLLKVRNPSRCTQVLCYKLSAPSNSASAWSTPTSTTPSARSSCARPRSVHSAPERTWSSGAR